MTGGSEKVTITERGWINSGSCKAGGWGQLIIIAEVGENHAYSNKNNVKQFMA